MKFSSNDSYLGVSLIYKTVENTSGYALNKDITF